jgi:hypothetical protein
VALGAGSVSVVAGLSVTGGDSTAATGGAVFFAAIVFAGFLAALRAAGLVPAAFFFAGAFLPLTLRAVAFFAVARLAIVRARPPADRFLALILRAVVFLAVARLAIVRARPPADLFFAAALRAVAFFAVARLAIARVRPPAALFFAGALRTGRLARIDLRAPARFAAGTRAMLRVPKRRFAAVREAVLPLAVLVVARFAVLRTDRFTDFLAADCFFAAMLASAREEIASLSTSPNVVQS